MSGNYPRKYVLGVNRMTGMAMMGWAADLPQSHFSQLQVVCVVRGQDRPELPQSRHHQAYLDAKARMQALNESAIASLVREHAAMGHLRVHRSFHHGCYEACLAAVAEGRVVELEPAVYPGRHLDALAAAVYAKSLRTRLAGKGLVLEGRVMMDVSGDWFVERENA